LSPVLTTPRLQLRELSAADAPFIFELVNDPSWLRYIGDKSVRDVEAAQRYIEGGPMRMYAERGFGLWLVERREDGSPLGICGLVKREQLEDVDLGFAFLPRHWRRGYATESARAVLGHALGALGLTRIVAITSTDNAASARLLENLGFRLETMLHWPPQEPVRLYVFAGADP